MIFSFSFQFHISVSDPESHFLSVWKTLYIVSSCVVKRVGQLGSASEPVFALGFPFNPSAHKRCNLIHEKWQKKISLAFLVICSQNYYSFR